MFNQNFSFNKALSFLSKTLDVTNRAIPIYKEVKPMFHNAKKIFNIVKEFNTNTSNNQKKNIKKEEINISSSNNLPTFFQ